MSDRIAVIQLRLIKSLLTIINVYGPTSQRNNNAEQDEFFAELARLTSRHSSSAQFYIVDDFNSMFGYRKFDEGFMGQHGLYVCNTAFQHYARHKTKWKGQRQDAATGHIVPIYNVIDFVICPQTYKRLLTDSRSYAGT